MTLAVALAALFAPRHRLGRLPLVAGIAGGIGVVLGAAVAGLLGLYLAVGAILAVRRRPQGCDEARGRHHAGRDGRDHDRGALTPLRRPRCLPPLRRDRREAGGHVRQRRELERATDLSPTSAAASSSTTRSSGRAGTASCRPRSSHAFSPTPARASPTSRRRTSRPTDVFIPQQTYDQVLYELGIVGALLFLVWRLRRFARRCAWRLTGRAAIPTRRRPICRRPGSPRSQARSAVRPSSAASRLPPSSGSRSA